MTPILCVALFASVSQAQQQPPLSLDEERAVLRALIDRDEAQAKVRELEAQLIGADAQLQLQAERIREERSQLLAEKKARLATMVALAEYRTTRRPLIVKIFTLGIVGDKHDKLLEAQIVDLTAEIATWK